MDQYIHRENIALYRRRLSETSDIAARKVILKLLADEEARSAQARSKMKPGSDGAVTSRRSLLDSLVRGRSGLYSSF